VDWIGLTSAAAATAAVGAGVWRRVRPRAVVTSRVKYHYHQRQRQQQQQQLSRGNRPVELQGRGAVTVSWRPAAPAQPSCCGPLRLTGGDVEDDNIWRAPATFSVEFSARRRARTTEHEAGMRATVAVGWLICLAGAQCAAFGFQSQQYAADANPADLSSGYFGKMPST